MRHRPEDLVCRNCGLPIAEATDPMRGVAPGQALSTVGGSSWGASLAGLAVAMVLVLIGGTLATTGGGVLSSGGRIGYVDPTPTPEVPPAREPSGGRVLTARTIDTDAVEAVETAETAGSSGPYTCEDTSFRTFRARWSITGVQAGKRKRFERVTIDIERAGRAKKATRIEAAWMAPAEARRMFGLPRFRGDRGLLLTFAGPAATTASQLIGPTDLQGARIRSIGGVYRFIDTDGLARVYVAVLDGSCVRIRAPGVRQGQPGKGAPRITLDFRRE